MYVDLISKNRGEEEVLLQQGTIFEILEAMYNHINDKYYLKVLVIDQRPTWI